MAKGSKDSTDWIEPSSQSDDEDESQPRGGDSNKSRVPAVAVAGAALLAAVAGFVFARAGTSDTESSEPVVTTEGVSATTSSDGGSDTTEDDRSSDARVVATINFDSGDGSGVIEIFESELDEITDSVLDSTEFRSILYAGASDEDVRADVLSNLLYARTVAYELELLGIDSSSVSIDETKARFLSEIEDAFSTDPNPAATAAAVGEQVDPYLIIVAEQVAGQLRLGDELQAASSIELVEMRCSRHILLDFGAEDVAEDLIDQLNNGADFASLAREFSTGPSGPNGGDLGCGDPDAFVPEFRDAVIGAEPGEIVGPVETEFGLHIIGVYTIQEPADGPNQGELASLAIRERLTSAEIVPADDTEFTWDPISLAFVATP